LAENKNKITAKRLKASLRSNSYYKASHEV
jgi:hypothetical protein